MAGSERPEPARWSLTVDGADPPRLAASWSVALGYVPASPPQGWTTWEARSGSTSTCTSSGGRHLPASEREPRLEAEAQRLVAAGARVLQRYDVDGRLDHVVLTDPEGDELCVA